MGGELVLNRVGIVMYYPLRWKVGFDNFFSHTKRVKIEPPEKEGNHAISDWYFHQNFHNWLTHSLRLDVDTIVIQCRPESLASRRERLEMTNVLLDHTVGVSFRKKNADCKPGYFNPYANPVSRGIGLRASLSGPCLVSERSAQDFADVCFGELVTKLNQFWYLVPRFH